MLGTTIMPVDFEDFTLTVKDIDTDEPLVTLMVVTSLLQVIKPKATTISEKEKSSIAMMIALMEKQFRSSPESDKQPLRVFLLENLESFVKELRDSVDTESAP